MPPTERKAENSSRKADFQIWIKSSPPTAEIPDGFMKDGRAKALPIGQGRILSGGMSLLIRKDRTSPASGSLRGLVIIKTKSRCSLSKTPA